MRALLLIASLLVATRASAEPTVLVSGLKNPESVAVTPTGKIFVSVIGEFNTDGDGSVVVVENGKATPFLSNLDDPKGLAVTPKFLFVADKTKVIRADLATGKSDVFLAASAFPTPPLFLNDLAVDPTGNILFISDSGDLKGSGGAVYSAAQGKVTKIADAKTIPGLNTPNGVAMDGAGHVLLADFGTGDLHRIKLADGSIEKLASGLGAGDGIAWDYYGRLFVSDYKGGKIHGRFRPSDKFVLAAEGFKAAADICYDPVGHRILVPDMTAGTLSAIPVNVPGFEVNETPLANVSVVPAFENLKWTGWTSETDTGKVQSFRPILLTHAGDGSNRIFVPSQQGVIHVFPNDQAAKETKVFLDISKKVTYADNSNEEGFLGLAFHPKYKENGTFFVFYTPANQDPLVKGVMKAGNRRNVVAKYQVSKDDPNKADPASEQIIMEFKKPFWNHDGGTLAFGPDGYLYIVHGDGGAGGDPFENGQNKNVWLGKILRIDVDHPSDGKPYSSPKDNPFASEKDAKPEIWAYGFRNPWRFAFDRQTGQMWAGEVGQNLFEEIVLVNKGNNYGWNRRESYHPFGPKGSSLKPEFTEPIWEYSHDVGKSITGGHVYRGAKVPALSGYYLYADYVSAKLWGLKYDEKLKRTVENRPIAGPNVPVFSFGEDEKGEVYFLTSRPTGKVIYTFASK